MNERPLTELNAEFDTVDQSRGVWFDCPLCPNGHGIYVPWEGKSPFASGAMWQLQSEPDLAVLTLSPSVNCDVAPVWPADWSEEKKALHERTRCKFHGWVQQGKVRW